MIEVRLQRFGGRGSSSGGAGGSRGNSGGAGKNSSMDYSVEGLPKYLDDDTYRFYEIRIVEGSKTRTTSFYGTRWQLREQEMGFAASHGMNYSQFMRQTRYAFMPITPMGSSYSAKHVDALLNHQSFQ